jgi:hypothetical protein
MSYNLLTEKVPQWLALLAAFSLATANVLIGPASSNEGGYTSRIWKSSSWSMRHSGGTVGVALQGSK